MQRHECGLRVIMSRSFEMDQNEESREKNTFSFKKTTKT